jgi:hypothetical protein
MTWLCLQDPAYHDAQGSIAVAMEWLARNPCTHHELINTGVATAIRDALRLGLPTCLGALSRVVMALAQEGHGQADVLVHAGVGMFAATAH